MLTRRASPSKNNSNDRFTDNLEAGRASFASSSSPDDDNFSDNDASEDTSKSAPLVKYSASEKHIINMAATNNCLKNIIAYGSLLYVGYQLGLMGQQLGRGLTNQQRYSPSSSSLRNSIITPPKSKSMSSIQVPASNKWLFKPPPKLKDMYNARNCESYLAEYNSAGERIDSKSLKIYTEEEWAYFRKVWRDQGGQDPSKQYKRGDKRSSRAPPDLVPPFKAGQTKDGKGRGVFATRDIKKGEMTYGGTKNYIFFTTGHDYRRFLDAFDDETACDLMKFTWPQRGLGPKHESVIWGPMDDNALQNDGGRKRANTGCPKGKHCGLFDEYALRDIKKGEEILCDYGTFFSLDFLKFDKWKEFGL